MKNITFEFDRTSEIKHFEINRISFDVSLKKISDFWPTLYLKNKSTRIFARSVY